MLSYTLHNEIMEAVDISIGFSHNHFNSKRNFYFFIFCFIFISLIFSPNKNSFDCPDPFIQTSFAILSIIKHFFHLPYFIIIVILTEFNKNFLIMSLGLQYSEVI